MFSLRNTPHAYGLVAIVLHWTIAVLIIGQLAVGLVMVRLTDQRLVFDLIQWHKSVGLLALVLVALRLLWRLANVVPRLPADMGRFEAAGARLSHAGLYLLMVAQPLSGWVLVSVSTLGIPTFAFYLVIVPHLPLAPSDKAEAVWTNVHGLLAFGLIALLSVHVAAAFWHHFVRKDGVLRRMLGKGAPASEELRRERR